MTFRKIRWLVAVALLGCSAVQASDIRRVVVGLDADNKSVVMFDNRIDRKSVV